MQRGTHAMPNLPRIPRSMAIIGAVGLLWLVGASPSLAASVPAGAREALAPLVAIAIGLGIAVCGAVIVWGGIEKTLAGANQDAEHRAARRIQNGIHGLVWMILASVIVSTITAIAVAYGLIDAPF
jgi:hypothetical protein